MAQVFMDLDRIDLSRTEVDTEGIKNYNPHRFEFMQLTRIVEVDQEKETAVAVREVGEDEFWVRGHIPGRPLFPGVLMIESAAQLASFYLMYTGNVAEGKFVGFGGVEGVKFRRQISPGETLVLLGKVVTIRKRRSVFDVQGVVDGKLAFEAQIIGMVM